MLHRRRFRARRDWALGFFSFLTAFASLIMILQVFNGQQYKKNSFKDPYSHYFRLDLFKTLSLSDAIANPYIDNKKMIADTGEGFENKVNKTSPNTIASVTDIGTHRSDSSSTPLSGSKPFVKSVNTFIVPNYSTGDKQICDNETEIIVYFQSSWENFIKRRNLRRTWASRIAFPNKKVKIVFILGKSKDVDDQVKINNERLLHGDIIVGDFQDSYQNLTLKSIVAMDFIVNKCKHVKYVIKVDDDIFLNMFAVTQKVLPDMNPEHNVISCHVIDTGKSPIVRDKHSKWFIPEHIFANRTHLPQFCSGYVVIMTSTLVHSLYSKAKEVPIINVDDVYMFGQLTQDMAKIRFVDLKQNLTLSQDKGLESYRSGSSHLIGINVRDSSAMEELWTLTLTGNSQTLLLKMVRHVRRVKTNSEI